jgi:hypothetical protein
MYHLYVSYQDNVRHPQSVRLRRNELDGYLQQVYFGGTLLTQKDISRLKSEKVLFVAGSHKNRKCTVKLELEEVAKSAVVKKQLA